MSSFTFWRTPEWYARRDARGSTLGHVRIQRHPSATTLPTMPPASQAQPALGQEVGASPAPAQQVPQLAPRSQA